MKISDYIVSILEREGVTDVFGIPGVGCGHFTDSLRKSGIRSHIAYHEQGAAFAACAYGQASGNLGVAYATAGPGATNLLTGIANAYVDSIPALYIIGDKDSDTLRGGLKIRQKASQEVDIVEMARPITKWACQITDGKTVRYTLEKAIAIARGGRPGPVLLDIPSDIQRMEYEEQPGFAPLTPAACDAHELIAALAQSARPLLLAGGGAKQAAVLEQVRQIAAQANIPVAATVVCDDDLFDFEKYVGFIGVDGDACANEAIASCDLLLCLGTRLNIKEVGKARARFARQARIIRIDIDPAELEYRLGAEETVCADLRSVVPELAAHISAFRKTEMWACRRIERNDAAASADPAVLALVEAFIARLPQDADISVGIGCHRRWFISARKIKAGWRIFQSAGLASMGYALPAAIGIHYASKRPVICLDGDGGLLMNVQELQWIRRERLPITVVVFNNRCLGEIRDFQKKIFSGNYFGTTEETGYLAADFQALAAAFHLAYARVETSADIDALHFDLTSPGLIEIVVPTDNGGQNHETV